MKIAVQKEDFDVGAEIQQMQAATQRALGGQIGAITSFIGIARDINEGESITEIMLEHYPGMTEKALESIAMEAARHWKLVDVVIIHRIGTLTPQDQIVLVAVASQHRKETFSACEFIVDRLKTRAPFWKKEKTIQGLRWVNARETDEQAAERWNER